MSMIGKLLIGMVMINLVFTFLYPENILPSATLPEDIFNEEYSGFSEEAKEAQPALVTAQADNEGLTITDALRMVWDWIGFLLKFQFAPIIIMLANNV